MFGLERAVRLELTNTGFAIRRLSRLATRAEWVAADERGDTRIRNSREQQASTNFDCIRIVQIRVLSAFIRG